jgi:putative intracellular protease/amidase
MEPKTIHLYVFDTYADWEPSYTVSRINSPMFQKQPGRYTVKTVSLGGKIATSMGGVKIQPDMALEELTPDQSALLIIPGGTTWDTDPSLNREVIELGGQFLDAGVPVAGICGATAGMARGGLLDTRHHTSNYNGYLVETGYKGFDLYQDGVLAFTDGDLITASGIGALEFAYQIFRRIDLFSKETAEAWYNLYKTGRPEYYFELIKAAGEQS